MFMSWWVVGCECVLVCLEVREETEVIEWGVFDGRREVYDKIIVFLGASLVMRE